MAQAYGRNRPEHTLFYVPNVEYTAQVELPVSPILTKSVSEWFWEKP